MKEDIFMGFMEVLEDMQKQFSGMLLGNFMVEKLKDLWNSRL